MVRIEVNKMEQEENDLTFEQQVKKALEEQKEVEEMEQEEIEDEDEGDETQEDAEEEQIEEDNSEEEEQEEEEKQEKKEKKPKKKMSKKKKIILICSIIGGILLITAGILVFVLTRPKKEETKTTSKPTTWQGILKQEAKDGTLKETLLEKIDSDEASLMLLDIDSDKDMELLAQDDENKLVVFEIKNTVRYSKDYDLATDEALSYAYNKINENFYWVVATKDGMTIVSLEDKEYETEDFNENFYVATNKYKDEDIFDQAVEVDLSNKNKDLSSAINRVLNRKFSNADLLENNDLSKRKIQNMLDEQEAAEEASKEEERLAEEKKKQEEEQAKKEAEEKKKEEQQQASLKLKVGDYTVEYKTYTYASGSSKEILKLNGDGTCTYEQTTGQENGCTYKVAKLNFGTTDSTDTKWGIELTLKDGNNTTVNVEVLKNNVLAIQGHELK